jgi:hypothetical protein
MKRVPIGTPEPRGIGRGRAVLPVLTLLWILGALTAGCGGGAAWTRTNSESGDASFENVSSVVSKGPYTHLRRFDCETRVGYDVRVHGISCKTAKRLELLFGDPLGHNYGQTRSLVYRTNRRRFSRWTCWARLEQQNRVIRHVCWHGPASDRLQVRLITPLQSLLALTKGPRSRAFRE